MTWPQLTPFLKADQWQEGKKKYIHVVRGEIGKPIPHGSSWYLPRHLPSEGGMCSVEPTVCESIFVSLLLVTAFFPNKFSLGLWLCTERTERMMGFSCQVRQEWLLRLSNSESYLNSMFLTTYFSPSSVPC